MPEFALRQEDERLFSLEVTEIETANGSEKLSLWMSDAEAMQLWEAVDAEIGDHVREMRAAKRLFDAAKHAQEDDLDPGWDPEDPRSPGYHDRMAGIWDERPGK